MSTDDHKKWQHLKSKTKPSNEPSSWILRYVAVRRLMYASFNQTESDCSNLTQPLKTSW